MLDHKVLGREFKKGLEQGEARGEAKLLRRILERRFNRKLQWAADKLATATPAQIEQWGERLLEEKSLAPFWVRNGSASSNLDMLR